MIRRLLLLFMVSPAFAQYAPFGAHFPTATATMTLVHAGGCAVSSGATTCTLTWPQAMATGNYDIFACVPPNTAQNPITVISSVNAGGTLVPLVGASTGSYGAGGATANEQSVAHILPSTSTGTAGTTVTITLNQAATGNGGNCYAAEWHPSASGSLVALDIDGSYQPTAAAANLTDISVTPSGTNDISFKMFWGASNYVGPTAVNAPYNTNFVAGGVNGMGFSTASGCGTGETWTNSSVIPEMVTVCVGFSPTAPLEASIIDWAGVTNAAQVTAAQMGASVHGWQGATPQFTGTITGSNVAAVQLNATSQRLAGDGKTYTGNTGFSISETGTGAAAINHLDYTIAQGLPATTGLSYWFCSTRLATDSNAQDIASNAGGGGTNFNGTGTTLFFKLEGGVSSTGTVNYTTDGSGSCGAGHLNNWVNIQLIGPIAGTDYMAVYQCASGGPPGCTLNQVGSTLTATSGTSLQFFTFGHAGSQVLATGKVNFWGPAYIFLGPLTSGSFPLPD
jgi:hypothetical protein